VEAHEPSVRNESARNEFPPVLTTALAAELLQIHVEYLRKMVREGKVPCHRFPEGREMRFLRDELLDWLRAQPGADRSPGAELSSGVLGTKNRT
jgi:excisionase family DNA binding protein